jgi:hypothetical protein
MPPKRAESRQKSAEKEGRILLALQAVQNSQIKSLHAAAKLYDIPYTTLHNRATGVPSCVDKRWHSYKLTQLEEDSLSEWIVSINLRGVAPRPAIVRDMANILLATRGTQPPPTVGENWTSAFIKRRRDIRSCFSRRYNYQRAQNEDPRSLRAWFKSVKRVVEENSILAEAIYNFDETGFTIGLISAQKVVTRAEYYGRHSILQPRNRE